MNLNRINLILLGIIGILVFCLPVIAWCSSYGVSNDPSLDSPVDGSRPFSCPSWVQIVIGWSALFILPLPGLFLSGDRHFIRPGFFWPPFNPPRFSPKIISDHSIHLNIEDKKPNYRNIIVFFNIPWLCDYILAKAE